LQGCPELRPAAHRPCRPRRRTLPRDSWLKDAATGADIVFANPNPFDAISHFPTDKGLANRHQIPICLLARVGRTRSSSASSHPRRRGASPEAVHFLNMPLLKLACFRLRDLEKGSP
jgi:hypothetical protein